MPPKSNNQEKKEAEAAGRPPKKTKQQENAGKTAAGKKKEMQAKRAADRVRTKKISKKLILFCCYSICKLRNVYRNEYDVFLRECQCEKQ